TELAVLDSNTLSLDGQVVDPIAPDEPAVRFESRLRIIPTGGKLTIADATASIENADAVTLLLVAATSFVNFQDIGADPASRCRDRMAKVADKSYQSLRAEHVADYQKLFGRVKLDLGTTAAATQP